MCGDGLMGGIAVFRRLEVVCGDIPTGGIAVFAEFIKLEVGCGDAPTGGIGEYALCEVARGSVLTDGLAELVAFEALRETAPTGDCGCV
jgi:hypothetical protein